MRARDQFDTLPRVTGDPPTDPPRLGDPLARLASSAPLAYLVVAVLALGYRLATFEGAPLKGFDANLYSLFAKTLAEEGIPGIRLLTERAATDETLGKGPLPLRIGYVAAAALTGKLLGGFELQNLAWLSFASGIAGVLLGFALLRAFLGPRWSLLGALLLIASPLATALARAALQDAFFAMLTTGCVLAFHAAWIRPKPLALALLGASLAAALLTKETAAVLYLVFLALGLALRREAPCPPKLWIPLLAAPLVALLSLLGVTGSLSSLAATYAAYYERQGLIEYARIHQQGPWFRYLADLLLVAPVAFLLAAFGLAASPADASARRGRILCALFALPALAALSALPVLNVRFVLPLDVPLRGLAALGIAAISEQIHTKNTKNPRWRTAALAAVALLALAADARQFARIFGEAKVYDPVTQALIRSQGFYNPPQPPK